MPAGPALSHKAKDSKREAHKLGSSHVVLHECFRCLLSTAYLYSTGKWVAVEQILILQTFVSDCLALAQA